MDLLRHSSLLLPALPELVGCISAAPITESLYHALGIFPGEIDYTRQGQPFLPLRYKEYISVSHSYDLSLVIRSQFPIGIDCEKIRPHHTALLSFIASSTQRQLFREYDEDWSVTLLWIIKEAVLKTMGRGILADIKAIIITDVVSPDHVHVLYETAWCVHLRIYDAYAIAISYPRSYHTIEKVNLRII